VPSATSADIAFWDTSGLALLCVHQQATHAARRIARLHRRLAIWWGTPVEARSSFVRLMREQVLSSSDVATCQARLAALRRAAIEVLPSEEIRSLAETVIDRFDVRAADAFQLAAALSLHQGKPRGRPFVSFDRRLAVAAASAGFTALPPP
jgi:predicted nucleic acid-binding protein